MKLTETPLKGAYLVEVEPIADHRGGFAVGWHKGTAEKHGLNGDFVQTNISINSKKGTLRGLHSRKAPYYEEKLVRCTRGSAYDVIVDIRKDSETYGQWFGTLLSAENRRMLYIPKDFLHGFLTLEDDTEITYQVTGEYAPDAEIGARYDDPAFKIRWPEIGGGGELILSDKDLDWPAFPLTGKAVSAP